MKIPTVQVCSSCTESIPNEISFKLPHFHPVSVSASFNPQHGEHTGPSLHGSGEMLKAPSPAGNKAPPIRLRASTRGEVYLTVCVFSPIHPGTDCEPRAHTSYTRNILMGVTCAAPSFFFQKYLSIFVLSHFGTKVPADVFYLEL